MIITQLERIQQSKGQIMLGVTIMHLNHILDTLIKFSEKYYQILQYVRGI